MRGDFRDIVGGWMLVDDFDDVTERIERAAKWAKANGPLLPDETATIGWMIKAQFARGLRQGFFADVRRLLRCKAVQAEVRPGDGGCLACPADQGETCHLLGVVGFR